MNNIKIGDIFLSTYHGFNNSIKIFQVTGTTGKNASTIKWRSVDENPRSIWLISLSMLTDLVERKSIIFTGNYPMLPYINAMSKLPDIFKALYL